MDTTFEFEKRRNVPVKYDRALVQTTVRAMKRITEIKQRRAKKFYEQRMEVKKQTEYKDGLQELEKNIQLVKAPESLTKKMAPEKVKLPKQKLRKSERKPDHRMEDE